MTTDMEGVDIFVAALHAAASDRQAEFKALAMEREGALNALSDMVMEGGRPTDEALARLAALHIAHRDQTIEIVENYFDPPIESHLALVPEADPAEVCAMEADTGCTNERREAVKGKWAQLGPAMTPICADPEAPGDG